MEETQQQKDVIESSDINELEEIFARKTGQPVPQKIVVPQKPKIETPVQQPQAPIVQSTAPIVKEPVQVKPQPEIKPPIVEVKTSQDTEFTPMFEQNTPPSLDKMMQYHLDQQKKNIDDEAALKKKNVETLFFNNMVYLINLAASGKPLQQQLTEQPSPPQQPQPIVKEVLIKDTEGTIKLLEDNIRFIDMQILDPNTQDVATLVKLKQNFQKQKADLLGVPFEIPKQTQQSPIIDSKPITPALKRSWNISTKVGLAIFALTIVIVIGVGYGVMGLLH